MRRWFIFFKERLPLPVLLLMSLGAGLSASNGISPDLGLACLMPALFLVTLRIMDEVKDYTKDQALHPDRPLPRGLISLGEATNFVYLLLGSMLLLTAVLFGTDRLDAGGLYLFSTLYLWLMFKEFYFGAVLEKSPILYAFTHQIVMLPLSGAIQAVYNLNSSLSMLCLTPGVMYLGAFFTFEVCRKLDPSAHPLLGTYRVHYGSFKTFIIVLCTSLTTALGAAFLGSSSLPFMFLGLLPAVVYGVFIQSRYKVIEGVSAVSLLVAIWAPYLLKVFT